MYSRREHSAFLGIDIFSPFIFRAYTGAATLTTLPSTTVNSTHWKWVFRCQGCTGKTCPLSCYVHVSIPRLLAWTGGGGIDPTSQGVLAWAFSNVAVDNPSDPESTFNEHTDCTCLSLGHLLPLLNDIQSDSLALIIQRRTPATIRTT